VFAQVSQRLRDNFVGTFAGLGDNAARDQLIEQETDAGRNGLIA
jgi:hypothetical protein